MVYILIVAGIFFLDFGIKHYVDTHRDLKEKTPVLNGKIIIRKYYNKGAALNFLEKQPQVMRKIQTVLMAAVGGSFLILLPKKGMVGKKTALGFILGGGTSNLYDRYKKGHVVDYFSFHSKWKRFSNIVFNISDFFIFLGSALLLFSGIEKKEK